MYTNNTTIINNGIYNSNGLLYLFVLLFVSSIIVSIVTSISYFIPTYINGFVYTFKSLDSIVSKYPYIENTLFYVFTLLFALLTIITCIIYFIAKSKNWSNVSIKKLLIALIVIFSLGMYVFFSMSNFIYRKLFVNGPYEGQFDYDRGVLIGISDRSV